MEPVEERQQVERGLVVEAALAARRHLLRNPRKGPWSETADRFGPPTHWVVHQVSARFLAVVVALVLLLVACRYLTWMEACADVARLLLPEMAHHGG